MVAEAPQDRAGERGFPSAEFAGEGDDVARLQNGGEPSPDFSEPGFVKILVLLSNGSDRA